MKGLTPIFLILLSLGAGFFYVSPQYQKIQMHRAEGVKYDDVIAKAQDLSKLRAELSDTLNTFSADDLDRLSKLVPEKVDTARLILDVSGIAAKYAMEMKDIQVTEPAKADTKAVDVKPYKTSTISFNFQSSYEGMIQFVKDLEQSLRMVDVTNITLATGDGRFPIFSYKITLQTYWLNSSNPKI